jgi:hypothetical protein
LAPPGSGRRQTADFEITQLHDYIDCLDLALTFLQRI